MSIKLSIVAGPTGSHQLEIKDAAERKDLDVSIIDVNSMDLSTKNVNSKLGDAVVWRSSDLDIKAERPCLEPILRDKIVVSDGVFKYPVLYHKFYQQQVLAQESATSKWSIPTFRFNNKADFIKAVEDKLMTLPVIVKPNAGSRGEGIELIRQISDITKIKPITDYVFQSFIPNDGDWRVIVVGGSPIGVLKRCGDKENGQFINNISKGAHGSTETDPEVLAVVQKISTKISSLFHLAFCGVDIIRNSETGEYFVLEVNTAPQWLGDDGFQSITGVAVAESVVDWIVDRSKLKTANLPELVETYYKKRINQISTEAFHFASRLWLWNGDDWARKQLDNLQQSYIGITPEEIDQTVQKILKPASQTVIGVNRKSKFRKDAFSKYNNLSSYNALLFKALFCDTVYNVDVRPYIKKYVSDKEFINLFSELVEDKDAVCLLSTHAINYFYLLKNYFKDKISLSSAVLVSPDEMMGLLPWYKTLEKSGKIDKKQSLKLQFYLLSHLIIGQSRFYSRKIRLAPFKAVIKKLEQIISDNYFDITLDNKLEFLVCSQICGYESEIRSIIEQEARQSVSWAGNFIVDTLNSHSGSKTANCLRISEHRNVLYIMSQKEFTKEKDKGPIAHKPKLPVIGRLARIKLQDYGIRRSIARVDSGASYSSIDASNIHVEKDGLHFTLLNEDNSLYNGKEHVLKDYKNINIRNAHSEQTRYAVIMKIEVNGEMHEISFALADRKKMLYPILLGRNFLAGRYTVDTAKQLVEKRKVVKEGN